MKFIKITAGIITALLFLVCIVVFIFVRTFDINQYKTMISGKLSEFLGRQVQIERLGLAMSPAEGILLTAQGVNIADTPEFSSTAMFSVRTVRAGIDVTRFITSREVLITTVLVEGLHLNVIRSADGEMNVQKITWQNTPDNESDSPLGSDAPSVPSASSPPSNELPAAPPPTIKSIRIVDAAVDFEDRGFPQPMKIDVRRIDLTSQDVTMGKPFTFTLNFALLSAKQNVTISGEARVLPENNQFRLDDVVSQLNLDAVDAAQLAAVGGGLPAGLPPLSGKLDVTVSQMVLGKDGLLLLAAEGRLGGVKIPEGLVPWTVSDAKVEFAVTESDVDIKSLTADVGEGKVALNGRLDDYLKQQKLKLNVSAQNIALLPLVRQIQQDVMFEGNLQAEAALNIAGLTSPDLLSAVNGAGRVEITGGKLKDMNLLAMIFKKLSFIPNISQRIEAGLPEKYKDILNRNDTIFQQFSLDLTADGGTVRLNSAQVTADAFMIRADGKFVFPETVNLGGQVSVADDLSASIVTSVGELRTLLDEDGRLTIPLQRYEGPLDRMAVYPDLEVLGKRVIMNQGKEQLQDLLKKVLKTQENSDQDQADPSTGSPSGKTSGEEMIGTILDSIFGGEK